MALGVGGKWTKPPVESWKRNTCKEVGLFQPKEAQESARTDPVQIGLFSSEDQNIPRFRIRNPGLPKVNFQGSDTIYVKSVESPYIV